MAVNVKWNYVSNVRYRSVKNEVNLIKYEQHLALNKKNVIRSRISILFAKYRVRFCDPLLPERPEVGVYLKVVVISAVLKTTVSNRRCEVTDTNYSFTGS
jgi:hypothetical protein